VFYDAAAMTDSADRAFLAAQGAGCVGQWCLKNLLVDVAAQPADEFCAAVPGGVRLSAAAVIGAVSRACGINPQVMVVTLQKESGLLDGLRCRRRPMTRHGGGIARTPVLVAARIVTRHMRVL
jgi:hypothetical protein